MVKGYDSRSYDLGMVFLEGYDFTNGDADDLAKTIQGAIEDWFEANPHVKPKEVRR